MKKTKLRKVIRESIKELLTEHQPYPSPSTCPPGAKRLAYWWVTGQYRNPEFPSYKCKGSSPKFRKCVEMDANWFAPGSQNVTNGFAGVTNQGGLQQTLINGTTPQDSIVHPTMNPPSMAGSVWRVAQQYINPSTAVWVDPTYGTSTGYVAGQTMNHGIIGVYGVSGACNAGTYGNITPGFGHHASAIDWSTAPGPPANVFPDKMACLASGCEPIAQLEPKDLEPSPLTTDPQSMTKPKDDLVVIWPGKSDITAGCSVDGDCDKGQRCEGGVCVADTGMTKPDDEISRMQELANIIK